MSSDKGGGGLLQLIFTKDSIEDYTIEDPEVSYFTSSYDTHSKFSVVRVEREKEKENEHRRDAQ